MTNLETNPFRIGQPYDILWKIEKHSASEVADLTTSELELVKPKDTVIIPGNALLVGGRDLLNNLLIGGTGTPLDNAHALVHVGDSTASVSSSQVELQGSGTYNDTAGTPHKWKKGMEAGYPQIIASTGAIRFRARFVSAEANFTWNEFGVSNGEVLFNRKVASPSIGTKTTEDEWVFSVEFYFS